MTAFYWDASAVVKRYRAERGSAVATEIFSRRTASETFATCQLLRLEVQSSASRALQARELTTDGAARMVTSFLQDYRGFSVIFLSGQLAIEAAEYVRLYQLKALDALHFAAAMRVREALPPPMALVTSDHDLVSAGARAGLTVLDPTAADASQVLQRLR